MEESQLSLAELQRLRSQMAGNKAAQNRLGPLEHRAYVRELTQESPVAGFASTMVAGPYTAVKSMAQGFGARVAGPVAGSALGIGARRGLEMIGQPISDETSDASLNEVLQAGVGFGEGLAAYLRKLFQ